jgi:peptide/nickel transport system substrate-binding protein
MAGNYWDHKIARRRAMQSGAALGLGAAFLAACGGSDDNKSTTGSSSGQPSALTQPKDTTPAAKQGGTLKSWAANESPNFDVIAGGGTGTTLNQVSPFAYQRLIQFMPGKYPNTPKGDVTGDFAESWELSPDKLTMTMKLRQNNKWDSRAPTNGRFTDSSDVMWTWNKVRTVGNYKNDLLYDAKVAPDAPIESISAPDANTITIKLKKPSTALLLTLAGWRNSFFIMPKEADGGFDARGEIRGTGPWRLTENVPSVGVTWSRNPDYFQRGVPYFDKYEVHTIPEHASQLAQFRAGNIWTSVALSQEILQTKRDAPETELHQSSSYSGLTAINFGYNPDSPGRDKRFRQAVSMTIDREGVLNALEDVKKFQDAGIDVSSRYHTTIAGCYDLGWLDPTDSKKFGPSSKYYTLDIAEAKKLLSAAGFPNGVSTPLLISDIQTGAYVKWGQLLPGVLVEAGIKVQVSPKSDTTDYIPNYHYAYTSNFWGDKTPPGMSGILLRKGPDVLYSAAELAAYVFYHKNGSSFTGASPDGNNAHLGDPKFNSLIEAIGAEFDKNKQVEMIYDLQRQEAEAAYRVPFPGYATKPLSLVWPVIGNYDVYVPVPGVPITGDIYYWQDSSKPPIGKS